MALNKPNKIKTKLMKIYRTKKRITKVAIRKTYALLFALIISAGVIGWHSVVLQKEISLNIASARISERQVEKKELSVIERIIKASGGENIDVLLNLAKCESNYKEDVLHVNTNGTVDLGVFQINSVHKDISSVDKLNVEKATEWTNKKIKEGKGSIWVCWKKI